MTRLVNRDRRRSLQDADWIVGWIRDHGPATIREIIAAMTPCMRLYAWLGQQLASPGHTPGPYRDWVETYASDEFAGLATNLEHLLDELAQDTPQIRFNYKYALRCELDFFEVQLLDRS